MLGAAAAELWTTGEQMPRVAGCPVRGEGGWLPLRAACNLLFIYAHVRTCLL